MHPDKFHRDTHTMANTARPEVTGRNTGGSLDDTETVLLTSADLARRWRMTVGAVDAMRRRGNGPPFISLGSAKRIRYRLTDVIAFEKTFTSLADMRAADLPERVAQIEAQRETFNRRVRSLGLKKRLEKFRAAKQRPSTS
jgi:hypothetical protein